MAKIVRFMISSKLLRPLNAAGTSGICSAKWVRPTCPYQPIILDLWWNFLILFAADAFDGKQFFNIETNTAPVRLLRHFLFSISRIPFLEDSTQMVRDFDLIILAIRKYMATISNLCGRVNNPLP